ncbi:homeobox protein siamois-like [Bufo gargarizans]|uniref:homeobox protein siamois-like n=1 Tax=Bufo gargarizans TaxID=30331 RepID=UPI001CF56AB7|nr:homeobox protein siamois-like [Bufo gargarizans]
MDSELDQVLSTILSLEEDYPAMSPTLVDQCHPPASNTMHLFPGFFCCTEAQQDLQCSLTLRESLLEIYNLVRIQQQAQVGKKLDPKKPSKIVKIPSSSSTFNYVPNEEIPTTAKRKFNGQENPVYKKARMEEDEMWTTASKNRGIKRTNYNKEQIACLTSEFERNPYPDFTSRCRIGRLTGISEPRIQIWFQNRRARHLLKPSKSTHEAQNGNFPATEKTWNGYNENPPILQLYGAAPSADPSWILSDMASVLY